MEGNGICHAVGADGLDAVKSPPWHRINDCGVADFRTAGRYIEASFGNLQSNDGCADALLIPLRVRIAVFRIETRRHSCCGSDFPTLSADFPRCSVGFGNVCHDVGDRIRRVGAGPCAVRLSSTDRHRIRRMGWVLGERVGCAGRAFYFVASKKIRKLTSDEIRIQTNTAILAVEPHSVNRHGFQNPHHIISSL